MLKIGRFLLSTKFYLMRAGTDHRMNVSCAFIRGDSVNGNDSGSTKQKGGCKIFQASMDKKSSQGDDILYFIYFYPYSKHKVSVSEAD